MTATGPAPSAAVRKRFCKNPDIRYNQTVRCHWNSRCNLTAAFREGQTLFGCDDRDWSGAVCGCSHAVL
jgi:hypothetical protein